MLVPEFPQWGFWLRTHWRQGDQTAEDIAVFPPRQHIQRLNHRWRVGKFEKLWGSDSGKPVVSTSNPRNIGGKFHILHPNHQVHWVICLYKDGNVPVYLHIS
jgi:hypothetical protein